VAHAAVALDFTQSVNRLADLASQWTLDRKVTLEQASQTAQLVLVQLTSLFGRVDLRLDTRIPSNGRSNAVQVLK
jgi:hypothetical protein